MERDVTSLDIATTGLDQTSALGTTLAEKAPPDQAVPQTVWQAPVYDFSLTPKTLSAFSSTKNREARENFFRTARWCMDGSAILTTSEDRTIQLFSTPTDTSSASSATTPLSPYLTLPQPSPILSSIWYPTATPRGPETFCFAAAIRDAPVKLIDGLTGQTRATYPIVDHRERFVAPYSMAWNPSATKLYCGHENAIEVLDISAPGYDSSERLKTTQSRGDKGGQKGIISALAFSTDYSGLYAAGSFSGSVSLYSEDQAGAVGHLEGIQGGGVTQLAFHSLSPTYLFIASRQSTHLQAYDLRNPSQPIHSFPRLAQTNQRLSFDIDPWGRYLGMGDQEGRVGIWGVGGEGWGQKVWEGKVSDDAISSVQFHPLKPLLLISSGSRRFAHPNTFDSDSDSDSDSDGSASDSSYGVNDGDDGDIVAVGPNKGPITSDTDAQSPRSEDGPGLRMISFDSSSSPVLPGCNR